MFFGSKRRRAVLNNEATLPDLNVPNPFTGRLFSDHYRKLYAERMALPVWKHKTAFFKALDKHQCILLEAETGSGKTTQVPQWCVEWLRHKQQFQSMVCCTQPRRLATVTVAQRVAKEMDVPLGKEVGYSIRFEEAVSPSTLLKYCTDGVLLAELSHDAKLERYGVIVLDEVHERTMITDLVIGLVKRIMKQRKALRVVVMSASLKTGKFARYFSNCCIVQIPGRLHPVEISRHVDQQLPDHENYADWDLQADPDEFIAKAVSKAIDIHKKGVPGDILVFLTGQEDVEIACEMLEDEANKCKEYGELKVFPLYGSMQHEQQRMIMDATTTNSNGRCCIVATNVAETSMTIDGVVFVIDPGFCKRKIYDPNKKLDTLLVEPISQASAVQRAGRAGRTRAGKCYRLYTEHNFTKLMRDVVPEIKHANLDSVILRLKKSGVDDIHSFDLMDAPSREQIDHSLTLLAELGALDSHCRITPLGDKIHRLPVEPRLGRMLLESVKLHCAVEVISICAMLSAPNRCFVRPRKKQLQADQAKAKFIDDKSDHLTLLRVFNAFTNSGRSKKWCYDNFLNYHTLQYADDVRVQLMNVMHRLNMELTSLESSSALYPHNILKAFLAGTFMQLAVFEADSTGMVEEAQRGDYMTVESQLNKKKRRHGTVPSNNTYSVHPSSVLYNSKSYTPSPSKWLIFNEAIKHKKCGRQYLQTVSVVQPEWLAQVVPAYRAQIATKSASLDRKLREHEPKVTLSSRILALKLRVFPNSIDTIE